MAVTIPDLAVTEEYADLAKLNKSKLSTAMTSIETHINTYIKLNLYQALADIFTSSYTLNNDGNATLGSPLQTILATLADNETITGSWTFSNTTAFNDDVSFTSKVDGSGQYKVKAYRGTSNQSISDASLTALALQAESYDVGSMHDNSTNNERITIPSDGGGVYSFVAQVTFAANATGRREVHIYKNGSVVASSKEFAPDATEVTTVQVALQDKPNANDYFDIRVYQNSGGALNVTFGESVTFFSAIKVW